MNKNYKPQSRRQDVLTQEFEDDVLIYDLPRNKAYCLNKTSSRVWNLCDGKHTVEMISRQLSAELKTLVTEDLIWLALEQFKKDALLENSSEMPAAFAGMSRREAIKRVGLTSMIALPMISSLVAPTAVQAASCSSMGTVLGSTGPIGQLTDPKMCGEPGVMATATSICITNFGTTAATMCCSMTTVAMMCNPQSTFQVEFDCVCS